VSRSGARAGGVRQAAILTDVTRCIGCERCVAACVKEYELPEFRPWRWLAGDGLSAERWTSVVQRGGEHFVRKQCRHCLEPACVSVCPVGALVKTPAGAVTYNAEICMGCRYCMMSCPYSIPRYKWSAPKPVVQKCILCPDRLARGLEPACTAACPTGATIFGEREELLAEARRRLAARPETYVQRIFGEKEVGGTAVLYISDVDLDFLALRPELGERPLPAITWGALQAVPPIFVGTGALMGGVYWLLQRRKKVAAAEAGTDGGGDPEAGAPGRGSGGHDKK